MNELVVADRAAQWHRLKPLVLDSVSSPICSGHSRAALPKPSGEFRQAPPAMSVRPSSSAVGTRAGAIAGALGSIAAGGASLTLRAPARYKRLAPRYIAAKAFMTRCEWIGSRRTESKTYGIRYFDYLKSANAPRAPVKLRPSLAPKNTTIYSLVIARPLTISEAMQTIRLGILISARKINRPQLVIE